MGCRSVAGSNIGGIVETQEMLDFCAPDESGVTFFDTAEAYGAFNEELVGEELSPIRDQVW